MISNERTWPGLRQPNRPPYRQPRYDRPAPPPKHSDDFAQTHKVGELQIERKHFLVAIRENARGLYLRISEEVGGRFNTVIVPASGLREFQSLLAEMVQAADELPPQNQPQAEPVPPSAEAEKLCV